MRNAPHKPRLGGGGHFQDTWPVFLKTVKVMKSKVGLGNCRRQRRLGRQDKQIQGRALGWILEQENELMEKLMKSESNLEFSLGKKVEAEFLP